MCVCAQQFGIVIESIKNNNYSVYVGLVKAESFISFPFLCLKYYYVRLYYYYGTVHVY